MHLMSRAQRAEDDAYWPLLIVQDMEVDLDGC